MTATVHVDSRKAARIHEGSFEVTGARRLFPPVPLRSAECSATVRSCTFASALFFESGSFICGALTTLTLRALSTGELVHRVIHEKDDVGALDASAARIDLVSAQRGVPSPPPKDGL